MIKEVSVLSDEITATQAATMMDLIELSSNVETTTDAIQDNSYIIEELSKTLYDIKIHQDKQYSQLIAEFHIIQSHLSTQTNTSTRKLIPGT